LTIHAIRKVAFLKKNRKHSVDISKSLLATVRTASEGAAGTIGVGISGGVDSIVLARCLKELDRPFVALHFDHAWRGRQSQADAHWVGQWCRQWQIPLLRGKARAQAHRGTSEDLARKARWTFFARAVKKASLAEIWLAHHADDLVETFLLQLLRGAGPEGLAGLRPRRVLNGIPVVRPLLEFSKKELLSVARTWKLQWREDATNKSMAHLRNRIRLRLLPYLKRISGRDPSPLIWRAARLLADENEFWESYSRPLLSQNLACAKLKSLSVAGQRRLLRAWLMEQGVDNANFEQIEQIRLLLNRREPAKVNLKGGRHCRRRAGTLFVQEPGKSEKSGP
jgi:tRNA(Ile)-lysidine synthetase-like protein